MSFWNLVYKRGPWKRHGEDWRPKGYYLTLTMKEIDDEDVQTNSHGVLGIWNFADNSQLSINIAFTSLVQLNTIGKSLKLGK